MYSSNFFLLTNRFLLPTLITYEHPGTFTNSDIKLIQMLAYAAASSMVSNDFSHIGISGIFFDIS